MSADEKDCDLLVIGGGINGCGIARDAAGRGLDVVLCEAGDLASGTSSASTKLIHGGLRYLEHFEFRLVREALMEREVLLQAAPHIIRPMRFVLPHHDALRPRWLIRLGLFLYDHIGGRHRLPGTRTLRLARDAAGGPLRDGYTHAFEYSDCWVEDARLVVLNAMDAARRGASVFVRTACIAAEREGGMWKVTLGGAAPDQRFEIRARALVNATGPWVSSVLDQRIGVESRDRVRLVKGSHIVVPKLFAHDRAYIFQNRDERVVFAIPFERDFTLIGTTDVDVEGDPGAQAISDDETAYLCDAVNAYFRRPLTPDAVIWSYAGVRPLHDDGSSKAQEATRDYVLRLDHEAGRAPVLSVFGGKITTYRRLAEEVLSDLGPFLPGMGEGWTASAALPGGEFPVSGFEALLRRLGESYPFLAPDVSERLARAYGTLAWDVLGDARSVADLGERFTPGLHASEVRYLMRHEWARVAEDVVWRRSKLGLRMSPGEVARLDDWMGAEHP